MADSDLQALLDPGATGRGIQIVKRVDVATFSEYTVIPCVTLAGRSKTVRVTTADSDATKNTAIRAAIAAANP